MTAKVTTDPIVVFMGTPEFAIPTLRALHSEFGVAMVVTAANKPSGRGLRTLQSAVATEAMLLGITNIERPESLGSEGFTGRVRDLRPDIICVVAFRILPRSVYSLASIGSFNVHASLLPQYRGAAPINHAIINGETETGVTSFLVNDSVDTGSLLMQSRIPIPRSITAGELHDLLAPMAAVCALETTRSLLNGTAHPKPQNDDLASRAPKLSRDFCKVNWKQSSENVFRFIHGLSPYPGAWTMWDKSPVKLLHAQELPPSMENWPPGRWQIDHQTGTLTVQCSNAPISITELQWPGKQRMPADQFVRGYRGPSYGEFEC